MTLVSGPCEHSGLLLATMVTDLLQDYKALVYRVSDIRRGRSAQPGEMAKVTERGMQERLGAETFLRAMEQGNVRLARFILEALDGNIVNMRMERGRTLLMLAALLPDIWQRQRFVKLLLGEGAQVNGQDDYGRTALSLACERGNIEVVKLLVQSNADPEIVDIWGNGALIYGALAGQTPTVEFLVRSFKRLGMDIHRTNIVGNSAIQVAGYLGHRDCVRILANHSRKWCRSEAGNGKALEDITFKRSPFGQNQSPTVAPSREREKRPHKCLQVSSGQAKSVRRYAVPVDKCQSHKKPFQDDDLPSSCGVSSHDDSLYINCFPFEPFSDIDQEYGNGCDLFQLIEPRAGWGQENSPHGLNKKEQPLVLPWLGLRNKVSADCSRRLESRKPKISMLLKGVKGPRGPVSTLSKGLRVVDVKAKLSGDRPGNPQDVKPLDKHAESGHIRREQDSNTCTPESTAWSQRWMKGQGKILGYLDGSLPSSHRDSSIGLPTVGKQGESQSMINKKKTHNVMPSSNSNKKDIVHPIAVGNGKGPSCVCVNSMGNTEGQGWTLESFESEAKLCLNYVQTVNSISENVESLLTADPPNLDTQAAPTLANVPFPRGVDNMLSERGGADEVIEERTVNLSDCELEDLQTSDGPSYRKRFSLPEGSYLPRQKVKNPRHPAPAQRKPPAKAFCMLRLFRRFTDPQLTAQAENLEEFVGGEMMRNAGDGRKLYRSVTSPNSSDLSRLAASKVNSTSPRTNNEQGQR